MEVKSANLSTAKLAYQIIGPEPVEVVIEMGLGACMAEWLPFARTLAKCLDNQHGILLYERAGINDSCQSVLERTPNNIAKELYELLNLIPHTSQIVLIGHSQGGLYAQQFARLYPDITKGLLLLDPLTAKDSVYQEILTKQEYKKSGVDKSNTFRIMYRLAKLHMSGMIKGMLKNAPPFYYYNDYTKEEKESILNAYSKPLYAKSCLAEYELAHKKEEIQDLESSEGFPKIPLTLVTHSSELSIVENMQFGHNTREFAEKIEAMWQELMKEYLTFTPESLYIEAGKSTHFIHLMDPDLIITAVKNIIGLS